ncbi:ATP-dependent DNA ligase [Phenylobacterium sp.]|uniref:ATP-dependent DNA ligase n=1 Tax=Phenylobacterium sp. TaxID=1871053 RepID=UPI00120927DA|nr:ATP-dependent DNA ligase [Phenylobacterium sp.]THD61426.1 MAG: ATP-dependent DNA ligase [Phenylobacterium sp.]
MTTLPGLPLALDFAPMEAKLVAVLPTEGGWRFEPKWDGFRCLAFRSGDQVELRAKSGKPLGRYFPDVVAVLRALPVARFIVDGELTIPVNGELSFDALQMRLHPAESRVRKLAAETPATLVLFDCLMDAHGESLTNAPLSERRAELEVLFERFGGAGHVRLSPRADDLAEAQAWLAQTGAVLDGVVAKRLDGSYQSGERAMLKIKRLRTADCVVGGFRYERDSTQVGSLLLGLYDETGKLDHVGFTSAISDAERPALTRRLEALAGGPGFTGDAPGGPSRWSNGRSADWTPLKTKLVVEVRYDHVTGDRFRHGTTLLRWRPDKAPRQCTLAQLRSESASLLGEALSV